MISSTPWYNVATCELAVALLLARAATIKSLQESYVPLLARLQVIIRRRACTEAGKCSEDASATSYWIMHAGTRPSRLRSLTRAGDAEPNQVSTSNSTVPQHLQHLQASSETSGSGLTHPRGSLTVRTTVKSEPGSDGSGSARTPGSVNIRVWKVGREPHHSDSTNTNAMGRVLDAISLSVALRASAHL